MSQTYKACPKCGVVSILTAQTCQSCGHQYRTQFVPQTPPDAIAQPPIYQQLPPAPTAKVNFFTTTTGVVAGLFTCGCFLPFICFMLFLGGCGMLMGTAATSDKAIRNATLQPAPSQPDQPRTDSQYAPQSTPQYAPQREQSYPGN